MLEFKIIQELKPNTEILEIIKSFTYKTKSGKVKHLVQTNLQYDKVQSNKSNYIKRVLFCRYICISPP